MSRPQTAPHAVVMFELTALRMTGEVKRVGSGYRPAYDIKPDYWTSVHHVFMEDREVATGEKARAEVWFLTPDVYPETLWVGRVLNVAEGSRKIGIATILEVHNEILLKRTGQ